MAVVALLVRCRFVGLLVLLAGRSRINFWLEEAILDMDEAAIMVVVVLDLSL